jgi:hypothetical protein
VTRVRVNFPRGDDTHERIVAEQMALKQVEQDGERNPPLAVVTWEDAYSDAGWREMRAHRDHHRPLIVRSVGFLVRDDDQSIRLVQSIGTYDTGTEALTVPRGMVRRIDRVTPPDPERDGR